MQCHEVDFQVLGHDIQVVEIGLDTGETIIAEAGAMSWMDAGIQFQAKMGDGSEGGFLGKVLGAAKRRIAGESLFLTHFTNHAQGKRRVAFAAPYPGQIVPVNLVEHNRVLFCQKDAFLCAAYGTKISLAFTKKLGAGFFGGEGFILEKLEGDGLAFIHAGGTVVEKSLTGGTIKVDTGCLVGFTQGIEYNIEVLGLKSQLFGGEGCFLATLSGHGKVWLQSMPFSKLVNRIVQVSGLDDKKQS